MCDKMLPTAVKVFFKITLLLWILKITHGAPIELIVDQPANEQHGGQLGETKNLAATGPRTKFVLLTTGEQIKLFPLSFNQDNDVDSLNGPDFFLIKPIDFDINDTATLDRLGRQSPFTKWLQHKQLMKIDQTKNASSTISASSTANVASSILPRHRGTMLSSDEHDERLYGEQYQSGFKWQKPFVSKIDYFFNEKFCKQQTSSVDQCLVVVWLDKANRFVRFGSLNLRVNLAKSLSSFGGSHHAASQVSTTKLESRRMDNATMWLQEYPPIDLCAQINATRNCEAYDSIVEKHSGKLVVIMGKSEELSDETRANRILIMELTPNGPKSSTKSVLAFNGDCDNFQSYVKNLNFFTSKWLTYLEKGLGSKVIALDLSSNSLDSKLNDGIPSANQVQVFDVRTNLPIRMVNYTQYETRNLQIVQDWPPALAMAMDPINSRLYFLMDDNRLYSSDLMGEDAIFVGQFSNKRLFRCPNAMFVSDGTIFISDVSRKSLVAYKIPSTPENQYKLTDGRKKQNHRVLLIEMPTISDFRIIDLTHSAEQYPLACDDEAKAAYSELEDDEKLVTCFKINQIDAHLNHLDTTNNKDHCSQVVFIGRQDGSVMNGDRGRNHSEVTWLLILLAVWLAYTLLHDCTQILKYAAVVIKLRRNQIPGDKSAILTTESSKAEPEKCFA